MMRFAKKFSGLILVLGLALCAAPSITPAFADAASDKATVDAAKAAGRDPACVTLVAVGKVQPVEKLDQAFSTSDGTELHNGDVLIAAITSCTNTSNPSVMLAAGLLAKKAVEAGLTVAPHIKTSLAPGSRIVTDYLTRTGLLPYLEKLGFNVAAYGCTTCAGASGPLDAEIERAVAANDLITCAVLSGNRNFEARIHQSIKANFLMSPALVVAARCRKSCANPCSSSARQQRR